MVPAGLRVGRPDRCHRSRWLCRRQERPAQLVGRQQEGHPLEFDNRPEWLGDHGGRQWRGRRCDCRRHTDLGRIGCRQSLEGWATHNDTGTRKGWSVAESSTRIPGDSPARSGPARRGPWYLGTRTSAWRFGTTTHERRLRTTGGRERYDNRECRGHHLG